VYGASSGAFQIPNQAALQPQNGFTVFGQSAFPSENLNENQREITHFGIVSLQHSTGPLDLQTSLTSRFSSLNFTPDALGDILYNGISQQAYKRNIAFASQTDGALRLDAEHTLRAGLFVQNDRSTSLTASQVLPVDPNTGTIGQVPVSIADDSAKTEWIESVYLQDEWKLLPALTVNYGARFDKFTAFTSAAQLSPRLNVVWLPVPDTTVHAGYSRYLSPPPFELVGNTTVSRFVNTTGAAMGPQGDTPKAERANYFDVGVQQKILEGFIAGIDTYYKRSSDLIDEGQFGAPIILTPFNYRYGKQYGVELTANYVRQAFSAYANLAFQTAMGRKIESAQFNFSQGDLDYIATHYIDLDHEQKVTGSGGASYRWRDTLFSADLLFGSGLRSSTTNPNDTHLPYYTQVNAGVSHVFRLSGDGTLTTRFDAINLFDRQYQIRNGTGVGVGAPQYGPRRGLFVGLSKSI
jgi:outer membrane receptor protein involved in Fe transport